MSAVLERVDRLEESIDRFIVSVGIEFNKLYNSQMRTEAELRAFKEEMREFKDEMRADRDEAREERRHWNRQWGELSNKLGTLVEDLVYPSLTRIIRETLERDTLDLMIRRKRRLTDGRVREFDAIAVTADLVCLNSTKSTLRSADVDRFPEEIAAFREFFPEYRQLPLVGILASVTVEESVLAYAERQGFLVVAVGDELMEVKNRPGFEPKRFPAPAGHS
jgi:hypothetical protein